MAAARVLTRAPEPGRRPVFFTMASPSSPDAFFGPLPARLPGALLWVFVPGRYRQTLAALPPNAVPLERCLTWGGWLKTLGRALSAWAFGLPARGELSFRGRPAGALVAAELRDDAAEGRLFSDLLYGAALEGLLARVEPAVLYYPCENLARERAVLLALRRLSRAPAVGYQHGALTLRHLNYRLGAREAEVLPLPDKLVASGPAALERLAAWGWPRARLAPGCGLRRSPPAAGGRGRRVVVALSEGPEEYEALVRLADAAFAGRGLEVALRPHPVIPLGPALDRARPSLAFSVDAEPLARSLAGAGALVYASSTAALDAEAAGVPAVAVEWGSWLPSDPLEGLPGRLRACDADSLRRAVEEALALDDAARARRADAARRWLESFSAPVTEEALAAFAP